MNFDLIYDDPVEEKEEQFDLNKYKIMVEEFDGKEAKKKQYLNDIEKELQELESLMK